MKKRFYCLLAAVLMAGACICVPVAEVKAEDGYNIDSYDNDDWYDSDDSPTDMVLDLSNVTIDKTSQTGYAQKNGYFYGSEMPTYKFTLQNTPCLLNDYDDGVRFSAELANKAATIDCTKPVSDIDLIRAVQKAGYKVESLSADKS